LEYEIDLLRLAILRLFTHTSAAGVTTSASDLTALARASASLAHRIESNHRQLGQDDGLWMPCTRRSARLTRSCSQVNSQTSEV
jgi:hypothetical protein